MWPLTSPPSRMPSSRILRLRWECPVFHMTGTPPCRVMSSTSDWDDFTSNTIGAPGWRVRRSRASRTRIRSPSCRRKDTAGPSRAVARPERSSRGLLSTFGRNLRPRQKTAGRCLTCSVGVSRFPDAGTSSVNDRPRLQRGLRVSGGAALRRPELATSGGGQAVLANRALAARVQVALATHPNIRKLAIDVQAADGVVTLEGAVSLDAAAERARPPSTVNGGICGSGGALIAVMKAADLRE